MDGVQQSFGDRGGRVAKGLGSPGVQHPLEIDCLGELQIQTRMTVF